MDKITNIYNDYYIIPTGRWKRYISRKEPIVEYYEGSAYVGTVPLNIAKSHCMLGEDLYGVDIYFPLGKIEAKYNSKILNPLTLIAGATLLFFLNN